MTGGLVDVALDRLVALVDGWQPGFADELQGAPDEAIAGLEHHVGPMPGEQIAVLRRMGHDFGGLNSYGDDVLDLRLGALVAVAGDPERHPERRAFTIAGAPGPGVEGLFYDRREGSAAPILVRLGSGEWGPAVVPEHVSMVDMLFGFAFTTKRLPSRPWAITLRSPGTERPCFEHGERGTWREQCKWICQRLGMTVIEHEPTWWVCADSEDATVVLYEAPGYAPDVQVGASSRLEMARISELLMDNLALRIHPGSLRAP